MTFGSESVCRISCKQSECVLPFSTPLTSDDVRTVVDDMWEEIIVSHPYKQSECMLPLPTPRTSADGRAVVNDMRPHIILLHP